MTTRGQLVNYWIMPDDENRDGFWQPLFIFPSGNIVHGPDNEIIKKYDYCGKVVWESSPRSRYHHSISKNDSGLFWVSGSANDNLNVVSLVDLEDGTQIKEITLQDIHAANSGSLGIFELTHKTLSVNPNGLPDFIHQNDVEPLLNDMASAFPRFKSGDLALSYRHANLVYVVDPETLQVKWWARLGLNQ